MSKRLFSGKKTICDLPLELFREIFLFLEEPHITIIGRVNKVFYFISYDSIILKENCEREKKNLKYGLFKNSLKYRLYTKNQAQKTLEITVREAIKDTYLYESINPLIDIAIEKH